MSTQHQNWNEHTWSNTSCLKCMKWPIEPRCEQGKLLFYGQRVAQNDDGAFYLTLNDGVVDEGDLMVCDATGVCKNWATRIENIYEELRPICDPCFEEFEDRPDIRGQEDSTEWAKAEQVYSDWKERRLG